MEYGAIDGIATPVSRLILGTMAYAPEPEDQYRHWCAVLDAFVTAGGNAVDTAYVYGGGRSERTLGRWMRERDNRSTIVVVGKGAHPRPDAPRRVTPEAIDADLTESLARLGTPCIDLYLLHRDDAEVPVGPLVECLNRHIDAGRLRAIGGSNWTVQRIEDANQYAAAHGLRPFTASSPNLSLAAPAEPLWPGCVSVDEVDAAWYRRTRLPILSWSSQARGFFSGRFAPDRPDVDPAVTRAFYTDTNWQRLERARALAAQKGSTPTRIALAWVLRQPLVTFPLIGPLTTVELQDSLAALDVSLTPQEVDWLAHGDPGAAPASTR